jgi:hypothetical protein
MRDLAAAQPRAAYGVTWLTSYDRRSGSALRFSATQILAKGRGQAMITL